MYTQRRSQHCKSVRTCFLMLITGADALWSTSSLNTGYVWRHCSQSTSINAHMGCSSILSDIQHCILLPEECMLRHACVVMATVAHKQQSQHWTRLLSAAGQFHQLSMLMTAWCSWYSTDLLVLLKPDCNALLAAQGGACFTCTPCMGTYGLAERCCADGCQAESLPVTLIPLGMPLAWLDPSAMQSAAMLSF